MIIWILAIISFIILLMWAPHPIVNAICVLVGMIIPAVIFAQTQEPYEFGFLGTLIIGILALAFDSVVIFSPKDYKEEMRDDKPVGYYTVNVGLLVLAYFSTFLLAGCFF